MEDEAVVVVAVDVVGSNSSDSRALQNNSI
jgi:hypothetical protein